MEIAERELKQEVTTVERMANEMVVENEDQYRVAGDLVKRVKTTVKTVDEYWEPLRKSTYEAYKSVTSKKSEMTDPLKNAEKTLKGKISNYLMEVERKKREEEERIRKAAEEELENKRKALDDAESSGDIDAIEMALADISVIEATTKSISVSDNVAKHDGISKRASFRITKIDPEKVPIAVDGVEIRPVDERAVLAVINATKGKITIPGIEFEESFTISVRA